jgi:plasmid stabilization system protein ParE
MTRKYKILWTAAAAEDLADLADFISQRESGDRALEVCDRLEAAASSLATSPNRGRTVPEFRDHGVIVYQELVVTPWRMIYRVEQHSVYILALIDSRQDATQLLWARLTR